MRYQRILVFITAGLLILVSAPRAESTGSDNDHPYKDTGLSKLDLCRADPEKK